jgi:hypothetical protein
MNVYLRQLLLLAALTTAGFAVYVLLFWMGAESGMTILFYRGIVLALITAAVVALAGFLVGRRIGDTALPIAAAALSLSANVCFLVLLPVTVDRSVTVYLLSTIEQEQQTGINASGLEQRFINGYVVGMGAIDRRLDEQRKSGNVTISSDGKVRLTKQGERFMDFSRVIARLFGTDPRFVGRSGDAHRVNAARA